MAGAAAGAVALQERSKQLRSEALEFVERTGIAPVLKRQFGSIELVGSVDFDLMTWRDIDIQVPVERAAKAEFVAALGQLQSGIEASGHCLVRATFNDEWARPRGDYGSGYYWGLRVRSSAGDVWKIDIWGWAQPAYSQKLDDHGKLKAALDGCDRELILRLKSEAMELPGFRKTITSSDIYRLVLNGGTSLDQLNSAPTSG